MHGISERPRELSWQHVAGLLFGDWGTSRLYVLGLAFAMSGHASFWYIVAMCGLVSVVGFAYTIICQHYPDGGGVYSAAKHRSPILGVIGALLLIADYIITASLSAYVGFRYILPASWPPEAALYCAIGAIGCIGLVNTVGVRRVGVMALAVAILAGLFYLVIGVFCVAHAPAAVITTSGEPFGTQWGHFVNVILALSGVEAVANMTGVMRHPVAPNARKAIFIVLIEVVVLNLVMAWAMNGLDLSQYHMDVPADKAYVTDNMVRILAEQYVGGGFAWIASIVFGFLLLSAANTAMGDMVSIQYMMSRDNELPRAFTRLNRFGMPWVGLMVATLIPMAVLLVVQANTEALADLYAIGVIGAITLNLLVTGTSTHLGLRLWEQIVLLTSGIVVLCIEATIAVEKPFALMFALGILALGLLARLVARVAAERRADRVVEHAAAAYPAALVPALGSATGTVMRTVRELPAANVTELPTGAATQITEGMSTGPGVDRARPPSGAFPANLARILVPTRGNPKLMKFAAKYAKAHNAALIALFVREVPIAVRERNAKFGADGMNLSSDSEAQAVFKEMQEACAKLEVPCLPMYAVYDSAADLIVDHAATLGVDAVIMGVSRRGAVWRTLRGDVIQEVVQHLPESIPLLIHA